MPKWQRARMISTAVKNEEYLIGREFWVECGPPQT